MFYEEIYSMFRKGRTDLKQKLEEIRARAKAELGSVSELSELESFRVRVLGKKGELTGILKSMGVL